MQDIPERSKRLDGKHKPQLGKRTCRNLIDWAPFSIDSVE